MAGGRRKSSRDHRHRRTKHTKHSRRTKHTKRSRRARTRTRRTRRGGDGSPYPASRMMPLNSNQTLNGGYFSRANQIGGGTCTGGILQPSGSVMNAGCSNGQMATRLVTGGRA